jgi:hypothetical protein
VARFSKLLNDGDFAAGVTFYENLFPGDSEDKVRLVIYAMVAENLTPFIVDTGAPWCVLDPKLARLLIANRQTDHIEDITYIVRRTSYRGALFRLDLGFMDEPTGDLTVVEATVFVPSLQLEDEWREPNFIGLKGCLERMRFAVDPAESAFYFDAA